MVKCVSLEYSQGNTQATFENLYESQQQQQQQGQRTTTCEWKYHRCSEENMEEKEFVWCEAILLCVQGFECIQVFMAQKFVFVDRVPFISFIPETCEIWILLPRGA